MSTILCTKVICEAKLFQFQIFSRTMKICFPLYKDEKTEISFGSSFI